MKLLFPRGGWKNRCDVVGRKTMMVLSSKGGCEKLKGFPSWYFLPSASLLLIACLQPFE